MDLGFNSGTSGSTTVDKLLNCHALFSSVRCMRLRIKDVREMFNTVVSNKKTFSKFLSPLPDMNDWISCAH